MVTAVMAQDVMKQANEKWRPKEGTYASPGKGFVETCAEFGDLAIALREKEISGHEWGCKVTAPDAIKVDMVCDDLNLAEFIKAPEDKKFKEVMLLKKIDEKSMSVRKTINGKFKDPEWRAVYCPKDAQRSHAEATARSHAEAAQRATEERQEKWHPRDGVYANPSADFNDRCLKSGDAVIGLAQNSVSSGATSCYVSHVADEPPDAVKLSVICNQSGTQGLVMRKVGGTTTFEPTGTETIVLKKVDDKTVSIQKTQNGQFAEPSQQLSYCGDEAQRSYTEVKEPKVIERERSTRGSTARVTGTVGHH